MVLQPILEKTWNQNILFSVLVELTYRCNLDCFFCYNDLGLEGQPLSEEQYFACFEALARLQVMHLTFSGGEPLSHPSFMALGSKARELGFVVRIKSNGHALRGRLAEQIKQRIDPFMIEISLHGADAATHDKQTRVPGSYDRLLSNLAELKSLGLRVKLNSTLTAWNEHQFRDMFDIADRLGVQIAMTPTVTPRDDGDTSPLAIRPSDEAVREFYRYLDERIPDADAVDTCHGEPSIKKNCGAGSSGLAIDPYGNVYPCVQWRRPLGNLHQEPIDTIWQGSPALAEVRQLNVAAKEQLLSLGTEGEGISHCLGLSEEKTGDPLGIDPDAQNNARLMRQVRASRDGGLLPIIS